MFVLPLHDSNNQILIMHPFIQLNIEAVCLAFQKHVLLFYCKIHGNILAGIMWIAYEHPQSVQTPVCYYRGNSTCDMFHLGGLQSSPHAETVYK